MNFMKKQVSNMSMFKIAYSPIYKYQVPEGHRFPMIKYELLPEQLLYEGTVEQDAFFHPVALEREEILLVHSEQYLKQLEEQTLDRKAIRKIGFPMTPALVQRGKHIARGTYDCARFAQDHGVALNIAGGTHHSFTGHGEGFCVFNDMAIASKMLLTRNEAQKILIIDLDVHQGNGTASIFTHDNNVFTFSMHGAKNYPHRKEKSDLDIELADGTEDGQYLDILKNTLPSLLDQVNPDFVFYLSGVDVLASDKLGRLSLSIEGCKTRDQFVFESCAEKSLPVAVSMGGGYSEDIKVIIEAHANTFRVAKDIFSFL